MIRRAVAKLTGWYMASWLFLLWSALCVCVGAAAMYAAINGVLHAEGIL